MDDSGEYKRLCSIDGCGRKHAAHDFCLMHYRRVQKYGTPEYKWGGKIVGRQCTHCDRPVAAREMCMRHYQMWKLHGDPLYSDKKKVGGLPPGEHMRRGYKIVSDAAFLATAKPSDETTEKTDRAHKQATEAQGVRTSGTKRHYRKQWEHRKVANAKPGEIVHHIDGDRLNNSPENLHVFSSPSDHGAAHRSLELLAFELLRRGLAQFDRQTGRYQFSDQSK